MTPDRLRQIASVLEICLELDIDSRRVYLTRLGAKDPALQASVEGYLESEASSPTPRLDGFASRTERCSPGERVGPYEIVEWLGAGGMGTVYLAERSDHEYHRQVAVKVLSVAFPSPEVLGRFRSERQIMATFDHPNIARMFDGGTTADGRPYLAMEYVEGPPFPVYCDASCLLVEELAELFRRVCSAVRYAHNRLVVHRDLKPSNVLVHSNGEPKLLDFGIAKLLDPDSFPMTVEATRTGTGPLTPSYASPEQLRGEPITTASDVYSLGVLLYLTLTGSLPHEPDGFSPLGMLEKIESTDPALPSRVVTRGDATTVPSLEERFATPLPVLRRQLEGDLDNIVLKALRVEPMHRYQSVEQLDDDLARYLQGLPVSAREGGLSYRVGKFVRRHKAPVAVATGVAGLAGAFVSALRSERDAAVAARIDADAARRSAENSIETEKAASRFLVDLLATGEALYRRGRLSVRELVERGAEKLLTDQSLAPRSLASLATTMGTVMSSYGVDDLAKDLLHRALEIYEDDPDSSGLSAVLTALGRLHIHAGRFDAAATELERALALLDGDSDSVKLQAAEIMHLLGNLRMLAGPQEDSLGWYTRSLEIRSSIVAPCDRSLLVSYNGLGANYLRIGEYDRSLRTLLQSVACFESTELATDLLFSYWLDHMGVLLGAMGHLDVALPLASRGARIKARQFGERHSAMAARYWNLFSLELEARHLDAARRHLEYLHGFVMDPGFDRDRRIWQVRVESGFGELSLARGDYRGAVGHFLRAGLDDDDIVDLDTYATLSCGFGEAELGFGDVEAGVARFERAHEFLTRHALHRPEVHGRIDLGLGRAADMAGNLRAAERHYRKAVDLGWRVPAHPQTQVCVDAFAGFLDEHGRSEETRELQRQHAERVASSPPPDLPEWLFEDMPD